MEREELLEAIQEHLDRCDENMLGEVLTFLTEELYYSEGEEENEEEESSSSESSMDSEKEYDIMINSASDLDEDEYEDNISKLQSLKLPTL